MTADNNHTQYVRLAYCSTHADGLHSGSVKVATWVPAKDVYDEVVGLLSAEHGPLLLLNSLTVVGTDGEYLSLVELAEFLNKEFNKVYALSTLADKELARLVGNLTGALAKAKEHQNGRRNKRS